MSGFASTKDLADKVVSFEELGPGPLWLHRRGRSQFRRGRSATTACWSSTRRRRRRWRRRDRAHPRVTDKPIRHVVLSHYHAVRVLGASRLQGCGSHRLGRDARADRRARPAGHGQRDRPLPPPVPRPGEHPRPDLADITFHGRMTLWLGKREVQIIHIGRSPHRGRHRSSGCRRNACCSPATRVEFGATPYCGDAHFTDWPATLAAIHALGPERLVPGRGRVADERGRGARRGSQGTAAFTSDLFGHRQGGCGRRCWSLKQVYDDAMALDAAQLRALGDLRALHAVRRQRAPTTRPRARPSADLDRRARRADVARAGTGRSVNAGGCAEP